MDPQLTEHLIRRRLILENHSESSVKDEKYINNSNNNFEVSPTSVKPGIIPSSDLKNNFLEKIKRFESFNDNRNIKTAHQNIVIYQDKFQNEIAVANKLNKIKEPISKISPLFVTNKLQFDNNSNDLFNDRNKKKINFHEKIKQFELSFVPENTNLRVVNTTNEKKHQQQTTTELTKQLKTKFSSKSDYNNWELDKTWVYYKDGTNLNNTKNQLKSKPLKKKKKR